MQSLLNPLIKYFETRPKKMFLLDAAGAFISSTMLGIVLPHYSNSIGLSQNLLHYLAMGAAFFFFYSFYCSICVNEEWPKFLLIIIILNSLYCFITIGLIGFHLDSVKILGLIYFLIEIILVLIIVYLEWKTRKFQLSR